MIYLAVQSMFSGLTYPASTAWCSKDNDKIKVRKQLFSYKPQEIGPFRRRHFRKTNNKVPWFKVHRATE